MLTVQFTLAIIVFICALTVSRQVSYVFSKDIGYNKEQLLVISAFPKQWDSIGVSRMINIKNALLQLPSVKDASLSFEIPDRKPPNSIDMQPVNGDGRTVLITSCGADENYAATFGLNSIEWFLFCAIGWVYTQSNCIERISSKSVGINCQLCHKPADKSTFIRNHTYHCRSDKRF